MEDELKWKVKVEKDTGALKEVGTELSAVNKATGEDLPKAAQKSKEGYEGFVKSAKGGLKSLQEPIQLVTRAMGIIGTVVGVAMVAWELYKDSQEKVIKATQENYDKHVDLIRIYEGAERAGVKLTDSQKEYKKALEAVSQIEGAKLLKAYEKEKVAIEELLNVKEKQKASMEAAFESETRYALQSQPVQARAYKDVKEQVIELTAKLGEYKVKIDAVTGSTKNEKDAIELATKAAQSRRQAKDIEIQQTIAHEEALANIQKESTQQKLQDITLGHEEKQRILEEQKQADIDAAHREAEEREALINNQASKEAGNAQVVAAQKAALAQKTADKILVIEQRSSNESLKIERERIKQMQALFNELISSGARAAAQRYAQTKDAGQALKALLAEEVNVLVQAAQKEIAARGAVAAAKAFDDGYNQAGGGYSGIAGGLAASAGVVAIYAGFAAAVGVAGGALSNAIDSGGGGTGGPSSASPASSGSSQASQSQVSSPSAVPSSGGGTGVKQETNLYLDGDILANWISEGTKNGKIQIHAKALVS